MNWNSHGKSIVAGGILVITALQAVVSDADTGGRITETEWVTLAIALTTAVSVYAVPNLTRYPWVKSAVAMILAGLQALVVLIVDGVTSADLTSIVLAALMAVSVAAAPADMVTSNGNRV